MVTRQTSENMVVELSQGASVKIGDGVIAIIHGKDAVQIKYNPQSIAIVSEGNKIVIKPTKKLRRKTNAMIQSVYKHIINVLKGGKEPYQKKLQIVYAHFPISVEIKANKIFIKNFLGEKVPREANIIGNTQVQVTGQDIVVKGGDIDAVGQTAANIIQSVRIVGKDRRVFQDGIYLVK